MPVVDHADVSFEVVGDPEDLPEAFFDALASLLLDAPDREDTECAADSAE